MEKYEITSDLVKNLISQQFPNWKFLPVELVTIQGWDNKIFRLGDQIASAYAQWIRICA